MKKWNCHVCDRDFKDSEEMDAGICRKCAKYTADIQSACAAGPWRTDVQNAPRDGSEFLIGWHVGDKFFSDICFIDKNGCKKTRCCSDCCFEPPTGQWVWAVPNPPQVTT